jgi:hypothetical protein
VAQTLLLVLWKILPGNQSGDAVKLVVFVGVLAVTGLAAWQGMLPRTRPIVPGELMVAD